LSGNAWNPANLVLEKAEENGEKVAVGDVYEVLRGGPLSSYSFATRKKHLGEGDPGDVALHVVFLLGTCRFASRSEEAEIAEPFRETIRP